MRSKMGYGNIGGAFLLSFGDTRSNTGSVGGVLQRIGASQLGLMKSTRRKVVESRDYQRWIQ